jgi:DNA-binding CsgD family transcriptional regulator
MLTTTPHSFDLDSFRKSWQADLIESEAAEIDDLIRENPLLNATMLLRQSALAVKDLRTMRYPCIFGDAEKVCGWSRETLLEAGVDFYVSHIPPADLKGVEQMNLLTSQYISSLSQERSNQFRALYDYGMLRSDGSLCRIHQESMVLKRDASGHAALLLVIVSDITNSKRSGMQHLRLTDGKENLIYQINNANNTYHQLEELSRREMEIARLMGQQLTSDDIARKLNLSLHTVNTHRCNMLRKYEMSDTMELINFLSLYRMI